VDPQPGTQVARGSQVTVSVSKGPATSQVPPVIGQTEPDAKSLLQGAKFKVTTLDQDVTDPSQDGVVLDQSPPGGTQAKPGSEVKITVGRLTSVGTETVPTTTTATTTTTPATTPAAPPPAATPPATTPADTTPVPQ
jgi:serine/threonine-protein kinase